ncbi:hypothetical protein [Paenibacillus sp. B01]|uniref:hypothetical protein n=1 Tax=Paenibacillus sp. B01 TaxID=2660554 RepID=UPI00129A529D|nr:hypothetical protein [Paenibacillus sp. B01]QGG55263.1 hypothetical protein GE073_06500 [Paenibacillus sp. B01]
MKIKSKIKFAASLVAISYLTSAFGSISFANPSVIQSDVNQYLLEAKYPQEIINQLDESQKEYIATEKLVYSSHSFENSMAVESLQQNLIVPFLTTGNWTRTLVASKVTTPTKGKNEFVLDFNWTWKNNPDYALEDKFGIAWTDDFDAYPESAVYSYRATGYNSVRNETRDYSTGNVFGYRDWKAATGVGWEYDIKDFFYYNNLSYVVNTHKGWGRIKIGKYSNKSGTTESTSAVGSYFHKFGAFNGTLSFQPTPSIGISNAINYDQFPDAAASPFSWTNYNY